MNVALPALIVFFLLLPGFIFRTNLKRAERTSVPPNLRKAIRS